MSTFQYEGYIRSSPSIGGSTRNEKDDMKFEMEIPNGSTTASESGFGDRISVHAIDRQQWTLSSLGIFMLVVIGPITVALLHQFIVRPTVYGPWAGGKACDTDPPWTSWATLFQVNIRSGYLSFTATKIIDIAWDTIIGRGGQFLLAWISYHVYTVVLTHLAESEAIEFNFFATTMLYGHSVWTFWCALKAVFLGMSRRAVYMLIWMVMSMVYVLLFPTLLSASTSYVAATQTAALLVDNTTVPVWTYLESATIVLTDHGIESEPSPWYIRTNDITARPSSIDLRLLRATHGMHPLANNLTVDGRSYFISNNTVVRSGYNYNNHFYDRTELILQFVNGPALLPMGKVICQPEGENYLWGASWELLVILEITLSLWAISMWIAWIVAKRGSTLAKTQRSMGQLRAVLDLAQPLNEADTDSKMIMGEEALRRATRQRKPVRYRVDHGTNGDILSVNLVEQ